MKVWVCCQTVHVWSRARSPGAPLDAAVFFFLLHVLVMTYPLFYGHVLHERTREAGGKEANGRRVAGTDCVLCLR